MKIKIAIFVLVLLLGGAGMMRVAFPESLSFLNSQEEEYVEVQEEKTSNVTFTPIPLEDELKIPNLDHEVQFSASVPEDVRILIVDKINSLKDVLSKDPTNAAAWYDLGVYYHNANDYKGAEEVWRFLTDSLPNDTVAYENLAKLYHFSLPDFPMSESYFKQMLDIDSESLSAHLGLFDLYRYSYKTETDAASDILNQAIVIFPETLDLVLTLGVYYRDSGNYVQARTVLEEGLNKARDANDVSMITAFGQEIERIPQ